MTLGHLLFAGTLTLYMATAALIEERDLVGHFGDAYRAYQRRVRNLTSTLGYTDVYNYSFISEDMAAAFSLDPARSIVIHHSIGV